MSSALVVCCIGMLRPGSTSLERYGEQYVEATQLIYQDHPELRDLQNIIAQYADYPRHVLYTGSRYICDPAVYDTDIDVVVIYNSKLSAHLQSNNFVISPHDEYPNQEIRACYRKGSLNVIAVDNEESYNKWTKAHALARHMNLRGKSQRVALFQFITEGVVRGSSIKY